METESTSSTFDNTESTTDSTSLDKEWSSSESLDSSSDDSDAEISMFERDRQMAASPELYSGGQITVVHSLLLLLRFYLVHALSKRAFEDLLKLVLQHMPETARSSVPRSVYLLKKMFVNTFPHVTGIKIAYCSSCQSLWVKAVHVDGKRVYIYLQLFITSLMFQLRSN